MRGALITAGTALGLLGGLAGYAVAAGRDTTPQPGGPAAIELSTRTDPDLPGATFRRGPRSSCGSVSGSSSTSFCAPQAGSGLTVHQVQDIGTRPTAAPGAATH